MKITKNIKFIVLSLLLLPFFSFAQTTESLHKGYDKSKLIASLPKGDSLIPLVGESSAHGGVGGFGFTFTTPKNKKEYLLDKFAIYAVNEEYFVKGMAEIRVVVFEYDKNKWLNENWKAYSFGPTKDTKLKILSDICFDMTSSSEAGEPYAFKYDKPLKLKPAKRYGVVLMYSEILREKRAFLIVGSREKSTTGEEKLVVKIEPKNLSDPFCLSYLVFEK